MRTFIDLPFHILHRCAITETPQQANTGRFTCMRVVTKRSTLTELDTEPDQEKMSKSFFAERRGFVGGKARTAAAPVVAITSRNKNRARPEVGIIDEGDPPDRRMQF